VIIDRLDEEFLLFALHQDGTWVSRRHGSVRFGLAGAWMLELLREGRVRQVGKKLVPKGRSLVDDTVLDMVLGLFHSSRRERSVTEWLQILSRQAEAAVPAIAKRLQGRGYVDITVDASGRERYPMHHSNARADLRDLLRAVMSGKGERDLASLDLLCLLGASGMTEEAFEGSDRQAMEERILELIRYDPHMLYMWKVIRGVRRWGALALAPSYHVPEVHFRNMATA